MCRCHTMPVLKDLQWLPIAYWTQFKMLVLTFKALNNSGPDYLGNFLSHYELSRSTSETLLRRFSTFRDSLIIYYWMNNNYQGCIILQIRSKACLTICVASASNFLNQMDLSPLMITEWSGKDRTGQNRMWDSFTLDGICMALGKDAATLWGQCFMGLVTSCTLNHLLAFRYVAGALMITTSHDAVRAEVQSTIVWGIPNGHPDNGIIV